MKKLILASNSPRRKDILSNEGYNFVIIPSLYDEKLSYNDPVKTAEKFALSKAKDVYERMTDKSEIVVLGADTVVYFNDEILGKPKDDKDAIKTLKKLSENKHIVITGFCCVTQNECIIGHEESEVTFNCLSESKINDYIKSGLYKGKAGSYGIQDGYDLVKNFTGDLNNIIGLPIEKLNPILKRLLQN